MRQIRDLGAKARAAGVHLIAGQVASQTTSRIILDQNGAGRLLGKGDLLASLGRGVIRAQAPLLSER